MRHRHPQRLAKTFHFRLYGTRSHLWPRPNPLGHGSVYSTTQRRCCTRRVLTHNLRSSYWKIQYVP
mgnify:CR=1 FL=1